MRLGLAIVLAAILSAAPVQAGPGDANADSAYLVGEFADPVCLFQHGMQGTLQRQCAMVRGRVDQGMYFLDVRHRRLYTVVGQNHWTDPRQGFLDALGDTFAVTGKVWRRLGSSAIAIQNVYPWRQQPPPRYRWWPWQWEWSVLLGCGILAALYGLAIVRLPSRLAVPDERREGWRAIPFLGAMVVILISLNGPIHDLSDLYLFSTHMIQHLLLAQVFPILLLAGIPVWLLRWLLKPPPIAAVWRRLGAVPAGFILYTVVFSAWHIPALYDLMMREHRLHIVMHLMVMATAVMMWWPVMGREAVERGLAPPGQMLYLFLLGTPMMAVAAMITFADHSLYEWYALAPRFMGMSAVDDQRLGGLIMWVPGGLFYWGMMSVVFFRWAARESQPDSELVTASPTASS